MDDTTFAQLRDRLTASIERERSRNNPPRRAPQPPQPRTEEDELIASGLVFTVASRRREEAAAEHWARRRRAERELASRQRLHDATRRDIHSAWAPDGDDAA